MRNETLLFFIVLTIKQTSEPLYSILRKISVVIINTLAVGFIVTSPVTRPTSLNSS